MVKLVFLVSLVLFATVDCAHWNDWIDVLFTKSVKDGVPQIDRACIIGKNHSRWTNHKHKHIVAGQKSNGNVVLRGTKKGVIIVHALYSADIEVVKKAADEVGEILERQDL